MSRSFRLSLALTSVFALFVSACNAPAPPAAAGDPVISQDSGHAEDGRGDGYEYHVRYPELSPDWTTLTKALRAYAATRIQQLLDSVPAPAERDSNAPNAVLDLEFNVARRTEAFVSVLAQGNLRAGGTAGPLAAAFVLYAGDNRLLSIGDLFGDRAAALQALSKESARQLEGRYEAGLRQNGGDGKAVAAAIKSMQDGVAHGTAPDAANFAVFLVDGIDSKAIGLTLIFAQAQLGMTSGGEQQVEVPAKVFYELLKPELRGAFAVDLNEIPAATH